MMPDPIKELAAGLGELARETVELQGKLAGADDSERKKIGQRLEAIQAQQGVLRSEVLKLRKLYGW